jgi:hypothetical protein
MVASADATLAVAETGEAKRKGSDVACNIFGGHPPFAGGAKTALAACPLRSARGSAP